MSKMVKDICGLLIVKCKVLLQRITNTYLKNMKFFCTRLFSNIGRVKLLETRFSTTSKLVFQHLTLDQHSSPTPAPPTIFIFYLSFYRTVLIKII